MAGSMGLGFCAMDQHHRPPELLSRVETYVLRRHQSRRGMRRAYAKETRQKKYVDDVTVAHCA
jgi:hypothetical protein